MNQKTHLIGPMVSDEKVTWAQQTDDLYWRYWVHIDFGSLFCFQESSWDPRQNLLKKQEVRHSPALPFVVCHSEVPDEAEEILGTF